MLNKERPKEKPQTKKQTKKERTKQTRKNRPRVQPNTKTEKKRAKQKPKQKEPRKMNLETSSKVVKIESYCEPGPICTSSFPSVSSQKKHVSKPHKSQFRSTANERREIVFPRGTKSRTRHRACACFPSGSTLLNVLICVVALVLPVLFFCDRSFLFFGKSWKR